MLAGTLLKYLNLRALAIDQSELLFVKELKTLVPGKLVPGYLLLGIGSWKFISAIFTEINKKQGWHSLIIL